MSRLLYLDCVGGAAGDMLLGALLDAGADAAHVRRGLEGLGVEGLELRVSRAERHGIAAARVAVTAAPDQPHRTWADVRGLLEGGGLDDRPLARAHEAFRRLAEAEGRVHGVPPEEVRFHEVGAVDALGEVCGVALALESLGVERVVCSPLPLSRGFVDAAHGRLPLPAPATVELLRGVPVHGLEVGVELVTPTGAALVSSLAEGFGALPSARLVEVGYGAGAREIDAIPNLVRALLCDPVEAPWSGAGASASLVETNLDDLLPELVPDAAEASFAAGALDVWTTPVQMKKGRPGVVLSALARPEREREVAESMLRETGSLGVRISRVARVELERESRVVRVGGGEEVRVKVGTLGGVETSVAPEHDDCARVAASSGRSVKAVWAEALAAAHAGERADAAS